MPEHREALSLGRLHLVALLAPPAAIGVAIAWWIGVGMIRPGAGLSERGYEEVLYSALFGAIVALVAVPSAAFRMWKTPAMRTGGNIAATLVGTIPIPVAAVIWLALLVAL